MSKKNQIFKQKKKGDQDFQDNQGAGQVVGPAGKLGAQKQGGGDQEKNGEQGEKLSFFHTVCSLLAPSRAIMSEAVTASRKTWRLIRLAAVV